MIVAGSENTTVPSGRHLSSFAAKAKLNCPIVEGRGREASPERLRGADGSEGISERSPVFGPWDIDSGASATRAGAP